MIHSLQIRNFKSVNRLDLNELNQVNLFTGGNNTGKSTILEAIALYVTEGDLNTLSEQLDDRGEFVSRPSPRDSGMGYEKHNIEVLSSLFTDRKVDFSSSGFAMISQRESEVQNTNQALKLRFIKFIQETTSDELGDITRKRIVEGNDSFEIDIDLQIGFEISFKSKQKIVSLNRAKSLNHLGRRGLQPNNVKLQYIRAGRIESAQNGILWDKITLTEKENYVVDALRIIEPKIERIAFVGEGSQQRAAVIKLKGFPKVIPIKSMGDGVNRILAIILALVNSADGYLLLDEFENGLHWSIQKDLWRIVFKLANLLNIQVFVTTHSNDCINGFETILNEKENSSLRAKMYRIEKTMNNLKCISFNKEELRIAHLEDIETR